MSEQLTPINPFDTGETIALLLYGQFQSGKSSALLALWRKQQETRAAKGLPVTKILRVACEPSGRSLFAPYTAAGLCDSIDIATMCATSSDPTKRTPDVMAILRQLWSGKMPAKNAQGKWLWKSINWADYGMVVIEGADSGAKLMMDRWAVSGQTFKSDETVVAQPLVGLDGQIDPSLGTQAGWTMSHYGTAGNEWANVAKSFYGLPVQILALTTHEQTAETIGRDFKTDQKFTSGRVCGPATAGQAGTLKLLPLVDMLLHFEPTPTGEYRCYYKQHQDTQVPLYKWEATLRIEPHLVPQLDALMKNSGWGGPGYIKLTDTTGIFELLSVTKALQNADARAILNLSTAKPAAETK